ncbi:hypothetical protein DFQ27_005037 [Actinomortierella ambigua]|uniref:Uncharacterized protein n=1 Tax=Actinomortierella ambigua TaxID=1343610 RepID=A0A9P6Q2M7_9FUNG|nr:hypothetical protein DFQ27_005037 [Actinomortierella ambigua]
MQFRDFDAFPKVEAGFVKKTGSGGILTLLVSGILCFLVLGEIRDYLGVRNDYTFLVDPLVNHKLQINVDVTVAMPCEALRIDLRDIAEVNMALSSAIEKFPTKFSISASSGSGRSRQKPLNVQKLIKAAQRRAAQESTHHDSSEMDACRIAGSFEANKLSGNMHITTQGHGYYGMHLDHKLINMTHKIDELSFGALYPTIVNPLDDSFEISKDRFEAFQYFLTVVPTIYIDRRGRELITNQYSVNEYRKAYEEDRGIPGLFFKYDIEPITVLIKEQSGMSFGHLLVRLAGLICGYFVTAGMVHKVLSAVYYSFRPEAAPLQQFTK